MKRIVSCGLLLIVPTVFAMEEQEALRVPHEEIINFDAMREVFHHNPKISTGLEKIANDCIKHGKLPNNISNQLQQMFKNEDINVSMILPCLRLFPKTIKNYAKIAALKTLEKRLELKTEDVVDPSNADIDKFRVILENSEHIRVILDRRQSQNTFKPEEFKITDANGLCVAADKNCQLLVGSKGGDIKMYNVVADELVAETLSAHTSDIDSLRLDDTHEMLISRSADGKVNIWNLPLKRRLFMINSQHTNDYFDDRQYLIQSHVGQSGLMQCLINNDHMHRVPKNWLGGFKNENGTSSRFGYLYMLYMLSTPKLPRFEDVQKFITVLEKAPERRDWEPEVKKAFKEYLRQKKQTDVKK